MSDPRERSQQVICSAILLFSCLLFCSIANAASSITLSKKSGPPTSQILVSGRGFESNVGVDIFFDTKDKALVVTNGKGEFHDAGIYVPRSARPGGHWVSALERNNDKGAQEPFLVQTNWSEFHFDADGTRLNPYENVLNTRTVQDDLGLKWRVNTPPGYGDVSSSPAVVNGIVYVGPYALNAATGALLWTGSVGGYNESSPAVANGVAYVGSGADNGQANVYALDAQTGVTIWSYTTGGGVYSSPAVTNGVVYLGSNDGKVYALDADTGAKLWSYTTGGMIMYCSPVVANGVVYIGGGNDVYALNARTGAKLWSFAAGDMVRSSPAVAYGLVYVGSDDGNLYALNAITGAKVWSYAAGAVDSSPAVANGVVYLGSQDSNLYALDASSGAKLWSFPTGFIFFQSPAVADGVVYLGSYDLNLYGIDARTGAKLWSYAVSPNSSPTVADGIVYVGSADGKLYAFGLRGSDGVEQQRVSKRPELKMLRPDFSLKASAPVAKPSGAEPSGFQR